MEIENDLKSDADELNAPQDSEVHHKVQKYRIIHVPLGSITHGTTPSHGAQPPRYNRERDEPVFEAAWNHVAELRAQGKLAPTPPFPQGGLKLRGLRHRRLVSAEQLDSETSGDAGKG